MGKGLLGGRRQAAVALLEEAGAQLPDLELKAD